MTLDAILEAVKKLSTGDIVTLMHRIVDYLNANRRQDVPDEPEGAQ